MAIWARKKGVSVVGTGDLTHPKWFAEINEKLVPAEPGLSSDPPMTWRLSSLDELLN